MTGTKPHAELGSGEKAIEQLALSVVVPVYNGEETLQDCLQAICNQTIPKDRYEVIVVDDGSTDSTPEISRQFPVRLISLEKNHGRIIARQTGAREASSETLVLCDSRVILERDVLETILATPKRPLMFGSDYPELQERTLFGRFYFCLRRQLYKPYYPQEWYGEELEVTEENFSKVPKGMGVFVTERDFFLRHQPQQTDRHTNDDTLMFSSMVRERPIIRYSKMRTRHVGRTRLRDVLGHLNHRGVRFRSYYLTPSHRYFWYYLCGWAAIVSLGVLVAVFPGLGWVVPAVFGGGWLGVSLKLANNLRNFLAVLVILPIVFLAFGTGLLRGHFIDLKRARRSLRERAQGRLFKTLLSWGLLAGIAVAAGWYVKTHWKEFRSLPSVPLWGWGAVVAGILLMHVWKGLTFDLMTRSLGVRLRGKERLGLSFLTSFGNLFGAARAGVLMRSVYLKRRGLPYSLFVSTLAGGYILSILALMLTGGAGLTWLYATGVRVSLGLALLVSGLVVATGALLIWAPTPPKWQKGIFGSIARALEGWRKILSHKQLVWKTLGTCLLIVLNLIAVLWIIYRLLGSHVPLGALAVMSSLGGIATLIAITPGAIGFFDAAVIVSGSYLGVAPEVGLAAMLVYRTTDAGLTLTLGGLSAWLLFRGKESMEDNSPR